MSKGSKDEMLVASDLESKVLSGDADKDDWEVIFEADNLFGDGSGEERYEDSGGSGSVVTAIVARRAHRGRRNVGGRDEL